MSNGLPVIGEWVGPAEAAHVTPESIPAAIAVFRSPAYIVRNGAAGSVGVGIGGEFRPVSATNSAVSHNAPYPCLGILPALYPEWLGDRAFLEVHGLRFPYLAGAMARGIASETLVIEMARGGMLGFFGAGGLSPARVEQGLVTLTEALGDRLPWGCNLIHSPQEPELENIIVGLLLRYNVRRVEASAFMSLTPAVVRYAFSGVTRDAAGQIRRPNHVFAKISRPEVAQHFMSPPPAAILDALVQAGELTAAEAALARTLPVAEDVTVESDSGGAHVAHSSRRSAKYATNWSPALPIPGRSASARLAAWAHQNRWRRPLRWARPMCSPARSTRVASKLASPPMPGRCLPWPSWPT